MFVSTENIHIFRTESPVSRNDIFAFDGNTYTFAVSNMKCRHIRTIRATETVVADNTNKKK